MQDSMIYSAAVELSNHSLGWMHGTQYPGVGWSKRFLSAGYQPTNDQLGPNGYNTLSPLATPAALPPYWVNQTIATFAGGFKREHGAFKMGDHPKSNFGSHYGFIENGVPLIEAYDTEKGANRCALFYFSI